MCEILGFLMSLFLTQAKSVESPVNSKFNSFNSMENMPQGKRLVRLPPGRGRLTLSPLLRGGETP